MISQEAQKIIKIRRQLYRPVKKWREDDYPVLRKMFNEEGAAQPFAEGTTWKDDLMNGVKVERVYSRGADPDKLIFYIHGGGMVNGSPITGRFMVTHIASRSGRNAVSVDYSLCPEHCQPDALKDLEQVYRAVLAEGYHPENIAFLGESAGGMLVLSFLAYIAEHGMPMPGCACAISGSVDKNFRSRSITENIDTEYIVCRNLPEVMKEIYYVGADDDDPVFSPVYADVSGWPPVYLHCCQNEILRDESVRMYETLQKAGVKAKLTIVEDMFHCYMLHPMPESYEAFRLISDFLKKY